MAVSFLVVGVGSAFFLAEAFVAGFASGLVGLTCGCVESELMASTPNPAARKHRRLWLSRQNGTRKFLDVVGREPAEIPVLRIKCVLEKGPIASNLNHSLNILQEDSISRFAWIHLLTLGLSIVKRMFANVFGRV